MKTKRLIAASMATCVLGSVLLAGCSSSGDSASASSSTSSAAKQSGETATADKVEINYYAWSEGDYLQEIVDAYNAQSDTVHVNMNQVSSDDYDDKLKTMLAGSNDIDVFNLRSGDLLASYASTGNLADLTSSIEDSGMDVSIYGPGYAETQVDGKFYALPYRSSSYALFYNKKIFDEKNVAYPDNLTWDEYADLAMQLTSGEGSDKFYGSYIPDWNNCIYSATQEGSNLTDDDLAPLSRWLERLNRFYNVDNSHMSYTDMKSGGVDAINFFCNSGCAMYPGGEWTISDILTMLKNNPQLNDTFELGIAVLPQVAETDTPETIGGVSTFIAINATSEKQEAAFDFLQYIAGKDAAMVIAAAGAIPAYIDDDVTAAFEEAIGVDGAENILGPTKLAQTLFTPTYSELVAIYQEEMELYLIGEQSLEETLNNFAERRAEVAA